MEELKIDNQKPLWWVLLVIFCMVTIYFIGTTPKNDNYTNDVSPYVVENFNGDHS